MEKKYFRMKAAQFVVVKRPVIWKVVRLLFKNSYSHLLCSNLAFHCYIERNWSLKTQRLSSVTDEQHYKRSLLAATVLYAVIKFDQNVKGEEKHLDKDKVLVFCSQNFEIYIDISIFQAHSKFPSRVSVIERRHY